MNDLIVIYRAYQMGVLSVFTLNDSEGIAITYKCENDAEKAVEAHEFIKHCEYEILEINI